MCDGDRTAKGNSKKVASFDLQVIPKRGDVFGDFRKSESWGAIGFASSPAVESEHLVAPFREKAGNGFKVGRGTSIAIYKGNPRPVFSRGFVVDLDFR